MKAQDGRLPNRRGGEKLIPLADPGLVARVARSGVNDDVAMRVEEAGTGRVVRDLGSRSRTQSQAHRELAEATPSLRARGVARGSVRILLGGVGPGPGTTAGTSTDHEGWCPAVFGDGDPCECGDEP